MFVAKGMRRILAEMGWKEKRKADYGEEGLVQYSG